MNDLASVLKAAVAQKASDIFLICDQPPLVRFAGGLAVLQGFAPMNAQDTGRMILSSLFEEQRRLLSDNLELDCTFTAPGLGRFRMNITTQQRGLHAVLRLIPPAIPTPEQLELPEAVSTLSDLPRGLVLVTGPAGSGRSTTLLCLIEQINRKRTAHIVTIEDPIEYFLTPHHSVICQREIGTHTRSYKTGLHSVLKQNADVVLVGEIRDVESAEAVLHIAESGPLVLSSMPTTDSMHTVERLVNLFPVEQHRQIQLRIASNLKAAISQVLLPRADGTGMVAAREILIMNPTIENAIREGKTPQIYPAIEAGAKQGMINMDRSILKLVRGKIVTAQAALEKSHHPESLQSAMAAIK